MRGDFTRSTFRPEKHYSGVRLQQGRVQLDADWNEQIDIQAHRDRATAADLLGPSGVPFHGPDEFRHFRLRPSAEPFAVTPDGPVFAAGQSLDIAAGHLYVEGVLCENDAEANAADQPHLFRNAPIVQRPDGAFAPLPAPAGLYLAYLDAWERDVSALEDPAIREEALGGPDTATRTQVAWQVRLLTLAEGEGEETTRATPHCLSTIPAWDDLVRAPGARLRARARPSETDTGDPCIVPPGGGFRRLENQLYRVEVHRGGPAGTATFKWSRENGSVATEWLAQDGANLTVASAGRDGPLGFATGQWVELTDDTRELQGRPGIIVQLADVRGQVLTIDPATADRVPAAEAPGSPETPDGAGTVPAPIRLADFPRGPKVRRWDLPAAATGAPAIALAADEDAFVPLEDGVEVRFEFDGAGRATFRAGDYWLIPARSVTADVEWPREAGPDGDRPAALAPHGVRHRFCRLALLRADADGRFTPVEDGDCRRPFPPLTELIRFSSVGGDGQSVRPAAANEIPPRLRQPLRVGVTVGRFPVPGARVRFAAAQPDNGLLRDGAEQISRIDTNAPEVIARTDADGIASCLWRPARPNAGGTNLGQVVEATLLDAAGEAAHPPIRFGAQLSVAPEIGYTPGGACTNLVGVTTVQEAIDELCKTGDNVIGIHIKEVRAINPNIGLINDGSMAAPLLADGLRVICDAPVDGRALGGGKPVCLLTLDLPYPFSAADRDLWGSPVIGFQPIVLRGAVDVSGQDILWRPADASVRAFLLDTLFARMASLQRGNRVLARLTLKGNFIWSAPDGRLRLDGDTFGVPSRGTLTDLELPSGDNRRGGDFEMWFWLEPEQPGLKALTLEQPSVTGATKTVKGFVTLSQRAPAGAPTTVTVTSNDPAARITPTSVPVPPGEFTGQFTIATDPVAAPRQVTITASFPNSANQTATLTIEPPRLNTLTLPAAATGLASATGTVTLNGPAPQGGIAVALSSNNPALATVPTGGTVTVPQNATSQTFAVSRVGTNGGQATITGILGETRSAPVRFLPRLTGFALNGGPSAVVRTRAVTGTVTLGNAVPFEVQLALSNTNAAAAAVTPAPLVVPANAQTATFTVTGNAVGVSTVTAALEGSASRAFTLAVVPRLTQFTLVDPTLTGGTTAQARVRVESAPPMAVNVTVTSSNAGFANPPSPVAIDPNAVEEAFNVPTGSVSTTQTVTLTATLTGVAAPTVGESRLTTNLTLSPAKTKEKEKDTKEKDTKEFDDEKIRAEKTTDNFVVRTGGLDPAGPVAPPEGAAPEPGTPEPSEANGQAFIRPEERPSLDRPAADPPAEPETRPRAWRRAAPRGPDRPAESVPDQPDQEEPPRARRRRQPPR